MNELFLQIPLSSISESPSNPRKTYSDSALDELASSIQAHGVLQPLLVRPIGNDPHDNAYEVVFGHRRLRAAERAGIPNVPCRIREMSDDEVLECQIIENAQREDVHPHEEALGYKQLIDRGMYDIDQIAVKVGKSAKLDPEVATKLRDAGAAIDSLERIAALNPDDQLAMCNWIITAHWGTPNASEVRRQIENAFVLRLDDAAFNPKDAKLVASAGSCVGCVFNTASQADIFADGESDKKQGRCLNKPCFTTKTNAHIEAVRATAVKKYGEVTNLSIQHAESKVGLPSKNWTACDADDPEAKPGMIVEHWRGSEIGKIVHFKPTVAIRTTETGASIPEDRTARLEQLRGYKIETTFRRAVFDACLVCFPIEPDAKFITEFLRVAVAQAVVSPSYNPYDSKDAAKHPGLQPAKELLGIAKEGSRELNLTKAAIGDVSTSLKALFILATKSEIANNDNWQKHTPFVLMHTAALCNVDVEMLRKEAEAKFAPKAKKGKAAA